MHADRNDSAALNRAILIWRSGRRISLALEARLLSEGYDVARLERKHA